jgi:hypothetical protein
MLASNYRQLRIAANRESVSKVGGNFALLRGGVMGLPIFHRVWGRSFMERPREDSLQLSAEEQAIYERLRPLVEAEARRMAKLLGGKDESQLFGKTEFELRDRVHALGAKALEVAADEQQKKGRIRRS